MSISRNIKIERVEDFQYFLDFIGCMRKSFKKRINSFFNDAQPFRDTLNVRRFKSTKPIQLFVE